MSEELQPGREPDSRGDSGRSVGVYCGAHRDKRGVSARGASVSLLACGSYLAFIQLCRCQIKHINYGLLKV